MPPGNDKTVAETVLTGGETAELPTSALRSVALACGAARRDPVDCFSGPTASVDLAVLL